MKLDRIAVLLVGCVGLLLAGCGTLSQVEVDGSDAPARRFAQTANLRAEVESLARPLVERGETPGIVVGVLLPDKRMQFFGYGVTDERDGAPPDGDTLFAVGSVSKGFVGALTALLVHDGTLSWDQSLGELLPATASLSADARRITLLQLATHTSGLPNQPLTFRTFRYFVQYLFTGRSFYRHFDRDYVFAYLADFRAPTRIEAHYSSLGYGLLAYVLEQRTGMTLDALLERKLARPLGLHNTGYVPEALPGYTTRAHGHAGDQPKFIARGKPVPDWRFTELMKGSGGVYSSARDLLRFAAAHLRGSSSQLQATLADTVRVRLEKPRDAPAVAWFVDDIGGRRIAYQVGMVAGFSGYLGLDAEHGTAVVVLQNSFNWTDRVGHKLLMRLSYALDREQRTVSARQPSHAALHRR